MWELEDMKDTVEGFGGQCQGWGELLEKVGGLGNN